MNTYTEIVYENSAVAEENVKAFNRGTYVISDAFDRQAEQKLPGVRKILIKVLDEQSDIEVYPATRELPVIRIYAPFDFSRYVKMEKTNRRAYILDILHQAVQKMCTELGYDPQPFKNAYNRVKELNYTNAYISGKLKFSPDRKQKAGIYIRVEEEYASISCLLQNKKGEEVSRMEILRTLPHYMFIYKFIHKTGWLDSERFQISDKNGKVVFEINVPDEKAALHLHPKNVTLPELMQEIAQAVADEKG